MIISNESEYEEALKELAGFASMTQPADPERIGALLKAVDLYEGNPSPPDEAQQAVVLNIQGIKCDGPGCDWRDDNVSVKDYAEWVDRPCPECGTNLLTTADYEAVGKMVAFADVMNTIAAMGGFGNVADKAEVEFDMDGSGQIHFKDKDQ